MEKQIEIRRAEEKDIKKIMDLLSQVLEIHAKIRPDVFVSGTTKYTDAELLQMFEDDQNPVYVAVDEKDQVVGYAFCKLRQQPFSNNMVQFTSLFIDDLCVDTTIRGKHIGQKLFLCPLSRCPRLVAVSIQAVAVLLIPASSGVGIEANQ